MPGAKCTGSNNDEFGHGLVVSDIERIYQLLETGEVGWNDSEQVAINTANIASNDVDIAANATDIATNATDISALTARVVILEALVLSMSRRVIDVCDSGTEKTMTILGTAPTV